jgi:hypothetical protein
MISLLLKSMKWRQKLDRTFIVNLPPPRESAPSRPIYFFPFLPPPPPAHIIFRLRSLPHSHVLSRRRTTPGRHITPRSLPKSSHHSLIYTGKPHPSLHPPSPTAPRLASPPPLTAHLLMVAAAVPSPVLRPYRRTAAPTTAVIGVSLARIAFTTPPPPPRVSRPPSNVAAA